MLEYLNFCLLCILFTLIFTCTFRMKRYLTMLKMVEELISNLGYEASQSDTKRQKLLKCVLTGNSKLYLSKVYTKEKVKELSNEEVDNLFNNYEAKLSGQMVKLLGFSIINMYLMGACAALGISNQDALSEDLKSDPFLNSVLQRFTCELYYRFSSFLAPLSVEIITSRPYLSEHNKNGGTSGTSGGNETYKNLSTSSKYEGLTAAMATELMIGFWFGIGAILAIKMVNSLEELINRK